MSTSVSYVLAITSSSGASVAETGGEITPILDHCADGLERLANQYQNSPRLKALICTYLDAVQGAEDDASALLAVLDIDTAVGAQLDLIGAIVGEPRAGFGDASYRRALKVRIRVNRSDGKAEDLIRIADLWIDGSPSIAVKDYYPAGLEILVLDGGTEDPIRLGARLQQAKAAGVDLGYIYGFGAGTFATSGTYAALETSPTTGFGSVHTTTGGTLSGVLG